MIDGQLDLVPPEPAPDPLAAIRDLIGREIVLHEEPYNGMTFKVIGPASWSSDGQYILLQGPLDQIIRHVALVRRRLQLDAA